MSLLGRSLRAATIAILALTFLGVLMSVYPIADFSTQSVDKPIIPIWEPGDEEQTAEHSDDDMSTPTLSSPVTQSSPSEAAEMATDLSTSEVMEAALREPIVEEPKKPGESANKGDNLLRGAFDNAADRFPDPVLPKVESPPLENTITSSEDPALTSTDQYPDVMAQPLPPQTPTPDSSVDTETFPRPPTLPDEMTSSPLPADSLPFSGDL